MDQRRPVLQKNTGGAPPQWRSFIWLVLMTLAMLWLWQEGARQVGVHTIPYSQFKDYVRAGEVVQCSIQQNEITGKIQPRAETASKQTATSAKPPTKTSGDHPSESKASSEGAAQSKGTEPSGTSESQAVGEKVPESKERSEVSAQPKGTEAKVTGETKKAEEKAKESKQGSEASAAQ
jgi:DNA polymerase III gamma/tau subunit